MEIVRELLSLERCPESMRENLLKGQEKLVNIHLWQIQQAYVKLVLVTVNDTLTVLLYRKSRNAVSYYIGYEVSVFFVVGPFPSIYFGNAVQCIF